jgi:hypothetical protein
MEPKPSRKPESIEYILPTTRHKQQKVAFYSYEAMLRKTAWVALLFQLIHPNFANNNVIGPGLWNR